MSNSPFPQTEPSPARSRQDSHFNRARSSIRRAISGHSAKMRSMLRPEIEVLNSTLEKLDQGVICIAAFGLVSRGKSAVLNALIGQKILQTGPLHGVTQYPRSVRWTIPPQPPLNKGGSSQIQVELIDTPGLDEIEGQARAKMAQDVARQADLILFVVSGDITRTEYQALCELRKAQKPIILVFNKIDLYPEQDRQTIYANLQRLGAASGDDSILQELLSPDEIVMVAAEPAPLQVRVEMPDGKVGYEWESPLPQINELKQKILKILNREGRSLLALNALVQARDIEERIARKTIEMREKEAEDLIWQFTKYKAIAIAVNPIAFLDIVGGTLTDLALIRALAKLYNLPMTSYEAGKLLKTILLSSGGLLLGEIGTSFLWGLGKSAAAISAGENPSNITAYAGAAIAQAGIAGYGAYAIGRAAQVYLKKGCTWGQLGPNTVIQEILNQADSHTILYRLRTELQPHIDKSTQ
ncbi:GTPase [[Phormidium ambiguum] IAM M-71]|uniref:GTPase n=1 Tax=[Phormidium ambiguum] IAM M-71 TaxID=454136 RepID=A0A1U7IM51_9CYAN|nr:GTP-binding protein [Phormidium ambiguum]OKH38366.1 GTPase [Phormidium ambiguum IAM M-71]